MCSLAKNESCMTPHARLSQIDQYRWINLMFLTVIIVTIVGNVMVVLAVCKNRILQNTTNYFLMSLAIADFLVAVAVMPLSMITEIIGKFPFGHTLCNLWVFLDIFLCTSSIWHMCLMSMDRFFTIRFPLKYGRNKTRTFMIFKIVIVWLISLFISSPMLLLGFIDPQYVFEEETSQCAPAHANFRLYGSIFAFYVPFFIITLTYSFTLKSLKILMKTKQQSPAPTRIRSNSDGGGGGGNTMSLKFMSFMSRRDANTSYLIPEATIIMSEKSISKSVKPQSNSFSARRRSKSFVSLSSLGTKHKNDKTKSLHLSLLDLSMLELKPLDIERKSLLPKSQVQLTDSSSTAIVNPSPPVARNLKSIFNRFFSLQNPNTTNTESDSITNHSFCHENIRSIQSPIPSLADMSTKKYATFSPPNYLKMPKQSSVLSSETSGSSSSQNNSRLLKLCFTSRSRKFHKPSVIWEGESINIQEINNEYASPVSPTVSIRPDKKQSKKSTLARLESYIVTYSNPKFRSLSNSSDYILRSSSLLSNSTVQKTSRQANHNLRMCNKANNERKALKVLIIIFSLFVLFWTPFFLVNLASAFCDATVQCHFITPNLLTVITWLGYLSSSINPIVYTMFNKSFRIAFINLLKCQTNKSNHRLKERFLVYKNKYCYDNSRLSRFV